MSRPPTSFDEAVWRELDQIRDAMTRQAVAWERAVERLERRDEERDSEVSELKLQVAALQARGADQPSTWKRDAGLVIAPSTIVAAIGALLTWAATPRPAPAPPPAPHIEARP